MTSNQNGINFYYIVTLLFVIVFKQFKMLNRWGLLVFQTNSLRPGQLNLSKQ